MKKRRIFSIVFALMLIIPVVKVSGQQPSGTGTSSASPVAATSERKLFDANLNEYKTCLKRLRQLKSDYQTSDPKQKDAIKKEFDPLLSKAETIMSALIPQALASYKSSKDTDIVGFLYSMLQFSTLKENYEAAYDIAKVVCSDPIPDQYAQLYAYASFSAFNVMALDDAEKWFKVADQKNAVEKADSRDEMHIRSVILGALPKYRELWPKEEALRAKESKEALPRVRLKTTKGDIVLELFKNEAPNAVGNFLTLVSKKFYTDVPFHRVLPYFMAQGGDPTGSGSGGPGYCIPCECSQSNARMHFRGSISMAHAGPDTGGSQFFLTFVPTFFLNNKHTVFGRVVEGMDVLSKLQRINPEDQELPAPDKILEAVIERGAPSEFKKLPSRR